MKPIGNQLYSNLAIGYILLILFNSILFPNPGATIVSGLHIALGFFVFFQLELGRSQFNQAVTALYVSKMFFLQEILYNFKHASFHNGITDLSLRETDLSELTNLFTSGQFESGPVYYFYGILYLLPLLYLLVNMDQWLEKNKNSSLNTKGIEHTMLTWTPFAAIALILSFNAFAGLNIGGKRSVLNLDIGLSNLISIDENIQNNFTWNISFAIIPIVLFVLYLLRNNYRFGLLILSTLVVDIVFTFFQQGYLSLTNEPQGELFPDGTSPVFVLVQFLLPIAALVVYIYFLKQLDFLKTIVEFSPLSATVDSERSENSEQEDHRPEMKFDDFVENTKHLLVREIRPVFLALVLLSLALITGSFLENKTDLISLSIGICELTLACVFMYGAKSISKPLIHVGFYGLTAALAFPIFLILQHEAGNVFQSRGIVFLNVIALSAFLIRGICILKAVQNDEKYVKFVSNRNNTRIFNLEPSVRFLNNEPNSLHLDKYSNELIPWKKRKTYSLIIISIQAYVFILVVSFLSSATGLIQYTGFFGLFTNLSFAILLVSYYVSIIRWKLIMNINVCIVAGSIVFLQLALMVYESLEQELDFQQGVLISLLASQLITIVICFIALNERKMRSGKQRFVNAELLDE